MDSALFTTDLLSSVPRPGAISTVHGNRLPFFTLSHYTAATFSKTPAVSISAVRRRRQFRPSAANGTTNSVQVSNGASLDLWILGY